MSCKIISTTFLVIIAATILLILAFKVKAGTTSAIPGQTQVISKGCCGSSGGGCAGAGQNQVKGE